jgi:hypothetical protein
MSGTQAAAETPVRASDPTNVLLGSELTYQFSSLNWNFDRWPENGLVTILRDLARNILLGSMIRFFELCSDQIWNRNILPV